MSSAQNGSHDTSAGTMARARQGQAVIDPLLDDREVERITGRARSTLQKDRVSGTGIPFVRIGRLVRYRQSDVAAYLAALPSLRSTSEADLL
jgi:predicted DNA-binding transcriptional regulator AlpA